MEYDCRLCIKNDNKGGTSMSGYYGISMSNNAVKAYEEGKKPYSKWTKKGIVDRINEKFSNGKLANIPNKRPEIFSNFIEAVKKTPLVELKRILLIDTEYHHTSIYYNSTIFYDVFPYGCNVQYMKQITSKLKKATEDYKQRPKVEKPPIDETKYHAFCEYDLVFKDGRKRITRTYTAEGYIIGNWFYSDQIHGAKRKNINGKRFRVINFEKAE